MTKNQAIKQFEGKYFSIGTIKDVGPYNFYKVKNYKCSTPGTHFFNIVKIDLSWNNCHTISEETATDSELSCLNESSENEFKQNAFKVFQKMLDDQLFLVGEALDVDKQQWIYQGIYSSEDKAIEKCVRDNFFLAKVEVDFEENPDELRQFKYAYYPRIDPKPNEFICEHSYKNTGETFQGKQVLECIKCGKRKFI